MRCAWACEGATWGPRRRASAMAEDGWTAVGSGGRVPLLGSMKWRSVRWCSGSPLAGFDVVVGDPSVAVLAEPGALVVAAGIAGQDRTPSCATSRRPDVLWDCERFPIHPWAGAVLPTRAEIRAGWGVGDEPVVSVLAPSWARAALSRLVVSEAPRWCRVAFSTDPADFAGADYVVTSAGWGPVWEARWSRVPHAAVHLGDRDHDQRANCRPADLAGLLAGVQRVDLPDDHRPVVPDHRPLLRSVIAADVPVPA